MRLIDADALIDELGISDEDIVFEEMLEDAPTIDAEPVVRCGDCKFCQMELYEGADEPWCDVHNKTVDTEAFCSWGRK